MKKVNVFICTCLSLIITLSCEDKNNDNLTISHYGKGVYIVNEGIFGQSSGTISYYNPTDRSIQNDIFRNENQRDLGNVVQSLFFLDSLAFIVVNNSNKIEIVQAHSFKEFAQILQLTQPRYFVPVSADKAYVSQWGLNLLTGSVGIIDLRNYELKGNIRNGIGKGPEQMYFDSLQGLVFVCNSGALENDHIISVIDVQTDLVIDTIHVLDQPTQILKANDGNLWVSCKGKVVYGNYPQIDSVQSTEGGLVAIDPNTLQVRHCFPMGKGKPVQLITQNSAAIYFTWNETIQKFNLQQQNMIKIYDGSFYGLSYDGQGRLYASRFEGIQPSKVIIFENDLPIDSFRAGVFSNSFHFKN